MSAQPTFEEYLAEAVRQRAQEDGRTASASGSEFGTSTPSDEKDEKSVGSARGEPPALSADERERENARRALRSAGWAAVFYLITNDILGPFGAPYAFSQVGYVPGVLIYVVMSLAATYTGLLLWFLFLKTDSDRYPVRTYADLAERVLGRRARAVVNVLQGLQLIVLVAVLVLSNGQALSQMTKGKLCFIVCILLWALVGMAVGQVRTLKNYAWLSNSTVWLNLALIFISMGFIASSAPNYDAAAASFGVEAGPVVTHAFVSLPLWAKVNGIMNIVFAYAGAMIFPEILAEMRRPWDFWKGLVCAQVLIFCAYVLYGVFVYSYQGQFTLGLAYQGVSKYAWQTVGNVISSVTCIISAGLWGNIAIKVTYINFVEGTLRGPPLLTSKGRVIWTGMTLLYWGLAFVVAAAIPQVQTIAGLVGAICVMQFTFTFPPLLVLGFFVLRDGRAADGSFSWKRGILGGRWWFKLGNLLFALAALTLAALGMYGSGTAVRETFKLSSATSFGCKPPV